MLGTIPVQRRNFDATAIQRSGGVGGMHVPASGAGIGVRAVAIDDRRINKTGTIGLSSFT